MSDPLTHLLAQLVAINSVNPALVAGAPGEPALAQFVQDWCDQHGLETQWLEGTPGRPSVIAIARGSQPGRTLLLNAHLDTVGVTGMADPFHPRIEGRRMYGRGTVDMKASLAACMLALVALRERRLGGDVILMAVADEEHDSIGTREALAHLFPKGAPPNCAAILTEPTQMNLHIAHRGFAVFEIATHGSPAHTSQPERGVDAIAHMHGVLNEIAALSVHLQAQPAHPLLGHGSAMVTRIDGGQELFTLPAQCVIQYERRTLPGETRAKIEAEVQAVLRQAGLGVPKFNASAKLLIAREPYEINPQAEIVQVLAAMLHKHGMAPQLEGAPYWMDSALIAAHGIPTVVFGPIGGGLHSADEWVDLDSARRCRDGLIAAASAFLAG